MLFIEDDYVVQALTTNRTNQAFYEWILPGRSPSRNDFLDTHVLYAIAEVRTIDTISIAYQKARRSLFGERFDDLLCCPFGCRILRDVEMNNHPAVMSQHNKSEQYSESSCRNSEKVDGHDVLQVIVKECSPCW